MQKQIEINGRKYLCVVVPKEAHKFEVVYSKYPCVLYRVEKMVKSIDLPTPIQSSIGRLIAGKQNYNFSILGTLDTISEEQSKDIVETIEHLYTINVSPRPYASILNAFIFENGITWNEDTETVLLIEIKK